jgi:hypothetical protein
MSKQILKSLLFPVIVGIAIVGAPGAWAANLQIVSADPFTQTVDESTAVSFDLNYTTDPLDNTLAGLGLRVHFDSSRVSFDGLTNILPTSLLPFIGQVDDDSENNDGDDRTDKKVVIAWADIFNKAWPGETLPVRLFTANFTTVASFNVGTDVNFKATSTATGSGYTFEAYPAEIQPTNPNSLPNADAGSDQTVDLGPP